MSGITPYKPKVGNAADSCLDAAADVGARLGQLRHHLASLDRSGLADLPAGRLQDLLAGYDIYARMLNDALHDIARDLQATQVTQRSEVELVGGDCR
ncbi:hypothetical protein [Micromonospora sp. NBC_01813]|uniref:hypothetical protein n=1 Tax=Micromonospora sp. NBC_01813 TaxID=2975988 RepID=UPI002DD95DAE|nr:hypothetical protein [Micromonospora sp. NBC_01813]WSA07721.1 hypothetical protein OG958_26380 [Micromonospora sp. NBC_01813]